MQNNRHKRHAHWEHLTGEHRLGDAGQLLLAVVFFLVWIADTFFRRWTTFLNAYVPLWIRIPVAAGLLVLAGWMAWTGLSIVFGEEREEQTVIRKSVFGVVRHPIYLSEILLYLGFLILSLSLVAGVVWLVAFGFLHAISRYEERLLLARFGEEYERYKRDVPMWVPRLRRK
jgi:protein-S-isoprenylcysteine O-methyltransferase Ste14